jgi:hypothetical protein
MMRRGDEERKRRGGEDARTRFLREPDRLPFDSSLSCKLVALVLHFFDPSSLYYAFLLRLTLYPGGIASFSSFQ